jgi:uncharacterized protein (TIGR02996 family)
VNDRDALFAAILAHPDEDTPRLAFADWLEERGDEAEVAEADGRPCDSISTATGIGAGGIRNVEWGGGVSPTRRIAAPTPPR